MVFNSRTVLALGAILIIVYHVVASSPSPGLYAVPYLGRTYGR